MRCDRRQHGDLLAVRRSVGIGFDIPADIAKIVVAQLKGEGLRDPRLDGRPDSAGDCGHADSLGMKKAAGALVTEPQSGTPAAKAGIAAGDVITAVNGRR